MARFLITSALPYINGMKHLGNLAGSMLPADVHARFRRLQGHEVLYLCATDEHGTPAELAAHAAGVPVRRYCDEQHRIQKSVYEAFDLSFDWFGRSSNPPNHRLTQHLCDALERNGLIEERTTLQVYSAADGRFLPDRYVEGICPNCGDAKARGDQCENCGRLLDPTDLIEPRSAISGSRALETRPTTHLFLRQSAAVDQVRAWLGRQSEWPMQARALAYKGLTDGLRDRAITRDLQWGVGVLKDGQPRPGFEHKRFYVWFDAPIEYIAAAVEWSEATGGTWQRWWRTENGADDVQYVQFMGKDNVAFHAASFPITLLGSGEPWKLVDRLKAFHWVNWYGEKFSTSAGRGIFMDAALEVLPSDYWRWYLVANAPENDDFSFTLEHFQATINADLANVLGNFVNRVESFVQQRFGGVVPERRTPDAMDHALCATVDEKLAQISHFHEQLEFRKAAAATRSLWVLGNEYFQAAAPWAKMGDDPAGAAHAVQTSLNLVALFALVAAPIIPGFAIRVLDDLNVSREQRRWPAHWVPDALVPAGRRLPQPSIAFRRIETHSVEDWRARFNAGRSN
jgi:methionyl-tRNA synthetase